MLEPFIRQQIGGKVFPGISILVASEGEILFNRHFGCKAVWPESEPLAPDTLFDLASLTKPLVTAFLTVYFVEKKLWRLDDRVQRFFPAFPSPVTLEQLLTHSAGFRPWHPFYLYRPLDDLAQIASLPDTAKPGTRVAYSDIGYILLRHLLEKVSGSTLPALAGRVLFEPLGLRDTFIGVPASLRGRCAPTEKGNQYEKSMAQDEHAQAAARFAWRDGLIRGDVHDANSFYSGGSAGNAGLFSSTRELFALSREFFPETATLLAPATVGLFWQDRTPWDAERRTIGFQLNSSPGASGGKALSPGAIGHTGFTGTSLWLEAKKRRQWILLSNRVHPVVKKTDFNALRRRLHRLLKGELGLG
jgi:CubicO group peptidase (beta-lactamase class C family)